MGSLFKSYFLIGTVLFCIVMLCSKKAFREYKNSSERLRKQSFTEAYISYAIGAIIYCYAWIISIPLTIIAFL